MPAVRSILACGLVALFACASPPRADEEPVAAAYRFYASGDCTAVREEVARVRSAQPIPTNDRYLALLEGYCLERDGDVDGARQIYSALLSVSPTSLQSYDAALRLRDLERLANAGTTREQEKQLAEPRWKPGSTNPAVVPRVRVPPVYPRVATVAWIEGWVLVDYGVAADGSTENVVVLDSSPPYLFEAAALSAIQGWTYEPPAGGATRAAVVLQFKMDRGWLSWFD